MLPTPSRGCKSLQVNGRLDRNHQVCFMVMVIHIFHAPRLPTDHSQLKTSKLEVSGILARLKTQYVKMFPQWKIERVAACRIMAATLVFNVACKTVLQLLIVNLSQIRHVSAPHWSEIEGWLAHSLIGFCSVTLEDTKLLILMQGISIDPVS